MNKVSAEIVQHKNRLEEILGMKITLSQLFAIRTGWNVFYENPEVYGASLVTEMIKLCLSNQEQKE